jgi:hypothetical protein
VPIDQQWVRYVTGNNRQLIYIDIIDVIYQLDATTLSSVGWLDNPDILFAIMLLKFLVMLIELSKLIW